MTSAEVLVVAGEMSADHLVAPLLPELRKTHPNLNFFGVGSDGLVAAGLERVADAKALGVVGLFDWFGRAHEIFAIHKKLRKTVEARNVRAAILVDLPDFNLRLAAWLRARGIPVAYYVSPQVWAWRQKRVQTIRERVDEMFVLFPFEEAFYRKHGVPVTFVGHPVRDSVLSRGPARPHLDVLKAPRIALLPGSRPTEHQRHLPLLVETLTKVRARFPAAEVRIPVPSTINPASVEAAFAGLGVQIVRDSGPHTVAWADAALVASGTATLEAALVGTPFALFYRLNPATVWAARHLLHWKNGLLGLPNWLLGSEVIPEFVFEKATSENLSTALIGLLESESRRQQLTEAMARCRGKLGPSGASARTAAALGTFLERNISTSHGGIGAPSPIAPTA